MYGKGDRCLTGPGAKEAMRRERMPGEADDLGMKLGERLGNLQSPTKYQSYTTGGVIYDDFSVPEHVDDFKLYEG